MLGKNQDMRSALNMLERAGRVIKVQGEVDPEYELPAVLAQSPDRSAVIFENVKGYSIPVIGNLVDRQNFALTCGIKPDLDSSLHYIDNGISNPINPKLVNHAPCRDVIITENINLMKTMPITTFF